MYEKLELGSTCCAEPECTGYPVVSGVNWPNVLEQIIALFPNHTVRESRAKFVVVDFFAEAA